jgi:hypothetical protein
MAKIKKAIPKAQNGKLTKAELDALSHQKRGMGEVNNTYVKKAGSIRNETGVLTNSQKEQLKKYMSKAGTAKSIYEGLPNVGRMLGHGNSAADIPKGSQLEKQRKGGVVKKKMRNGGSLSGLKASTKRDKGTDPNGAYTKVQEAALAGARMTPKLKKNKELGATSMGRSEKSYGLDKKQAAYKEMNPATFRNAALKRESELVEKRSGEMAPKLKMSKKK